MIGSWLAFPLLLIVLALGCGLLLERLTRVRIPGALLVPAGLATVIVAGQLTTATDATAELTAPLVVALAVAGFMISVRWRRVRPDPWLAAAATLVFVVYGAPVLLSGEATFAGYIRLDDTATWLALTDRVMEHGHSVDGLAPSTYEATLAFNLGDGYPVGVFVPLGIGSALTGIDSAWLIQPYISLLAAMLALALWQLLRRFIASRPLRAAAVAIAAQPALLVGYAQWGGIKEVAAAALVALSVALIPGVAGPGPPGGRIVVLGVALAALLAVLSLGGLIWVLPALGIAAALLSRTISPRLALHRAGALAIVVSALSLPLLVPAILNGRLLPPTSSSLASESAQGNLVEPLGLDRLFGIWPSGDFRLGAVDGVVTTLLILVAAGAALLGLWWAARSRHMGLALYGGGVLIACLVLVAVGSPWVDGKAMATASPALLVLACAGACVAIGRGRRVEGGIVLTAIAAGVLWSNALASRDASLAPRDQLAELERIGEEIAGQGPALMTEYQPYGARHFLREADAEAVSELRRREVPLRAGGTVTKGNWADTDDLALDGLTVYRTLVLRRSPEQSRPPSPYVLVSSGDYYDVWQRPAGPPAAIGEHLSLGDGLDPAGAAPCDKVRGLTRAGNRIEAAPASAAPLIVSPLALPADWTVGDPSSFVLASGGSATGAVDVPSAGLRRVWVKGSIRGTLTARVDGIEVGSISHFLNNAGLYAEVGEVELGAGKHTVELEYSGADLAHPGSGGLAGPVGPIVLTMAGDGRGGLRSVDSGAARTLCGDRLDWVESLP